MGCGNCSVVDFTVVLVSRTASFCCGSYRGMFIFVVVATVVCLYLLW
jgi:hypothetical protein